MHLEISKKFRFESAHYLPGFPEGHKCRRLHGHSFEVEVFVTGKVNDSGTIMDYGDIKEIVKPFVELLDHRLINEVGEELNESLLKNPTSENLARWFFIKLDGLLAGLSCIRIQETCTSACTLSREK